MICAAGMRSDLPFIEKISAMDVKVNVIGDAVRPGKVTQAVFQGHYCAKYL